MAESFGVSAVSPPVLGMVVAARQTAIALNTFGLDSAKAAHFGFANQPASSLLLGREHPPISLCDRFSLNATLDGIARPDLRVLLRNPRAKGGVILCFQEHDLYSSSKVGRLKLG